MELFLCSACSFFHINESDKVRVVQPFTMKYSLFLTGFCAIFWDKNIREDILPTLNINTFIFIKDVLALINKHCMNV